METGNSNQALNWYSYGNKCDTNKVSSSFRGANAFKNYFIERAKYYHDINKGETKDEIYRMCTVGDAVSFYKIKGGSKIASHTMIVVRKDYATKTVYLAAHTSPTNDTPLYTKINGYDGCYVFSMK